MNYQFTRALSLRGILDYNAILPNESLVALDRRKHLTADVLVTYLMHPGTAVYVGYTDGYFQRDEPGVRARELSVQVLSGRGGIVQGDKIGALHN